MIWILALMGLGVTAAVASSSSSSRLKPIRLIPIAPIEPISASAPPGFADVEQMFRDAEARGEEKRAQQEAEARQAVNDYYDSVTRALLSSGIGSAVGAFLYAIGPFAKSFYQQGISAGKTIAGWVTKNKDLNSPEDRARAVDRANALAALGFAVPPPVAGMTDDFRSWANVLEIQLNKVRELFSASPDVASAWGQLIAWVNANPTHKAVLDARALGAWPVMPDIRAGGPGKAPKSYAPNLAIGSLFAAMRGKSPTPVREAIYEYLTVRIPRDNPSLNYADNFQWQLGGVIGIADKLTR